MKFGFDQSIVTIDSTAHRLTVPPPTIAAKW
jgi:hypothetical protein